jgi:hypothetical protein
MRQSYIHMNRPLTIAVCNDHYDAAKMLIEHGAMIDDSETIYYAIVLKRVHIFKLMVDMGLDINMKVSDIAYNLNCNLLSLACKEKSSSIVYLLLDHGVNVMLHKSIILDRVIPYDYVEVMRRYLEKGGYGKITLNKCMREVISVEMLDLLISYGAKIETNTKAATPLYEAVCASRVDVVRELIKRGANVNRKCLGDPMIHRGACNYDIMKELLDAGADVNATDAKGYTALHYTDNVDTAQLMIDRGAKLNTQAKDGCTPLHKAVLFYRYDVAILLIDRGADVLIPHSNGNTPLDMIINRNSEHMSKCVDPVVLMRQLLQIQDDSSTDDE